MRFTDLDKESGVTSLNSYLEDRSYIEGYEPSQADVAVFKALHGKAPGASTNPHAARWYAHIASYSVEFDKLPAGKGSDEKAAAEGDDDEDIDLFGSDEEDEEAEKAKEARLAEYRAKKAAKPKVIAKSMIILDVKPWDDETDMKKLEECVRSIKLDGLVWGASKFVDVSYGIKKLQISSVVEDDKVGVVDLEEKITAFEDYVQSVDVAAFNKL